MNKLETEVKDALRLTDRAAEKLTGEIQRNIRKARAEMARVGIPEKFAESEDVLVEDAIITYCLYRMDGESQKEANREAWEFQLDNIRKSPKLWEEKKP